MDNFISKSLDILYARVDTLDMKNSDTIQSKVYGTITKEQALEILLARVREDAAQPRTASFSNGTPKGGWTEADKVTK